MHSLNPVAWLNDLQVWTTGMAGVGSAAVPIWILNLEVKAENQHDRALSIKPS